MTLFQRNTMDSYRGRVFGALGEAIGIVPVLAVQGAGYVLAGFAVLVLMRQVRVAAAPAVAAATP